VLNKLEEREAARYVNQLRYFQKKIDENLAAVELKFVNIEGQSFDIGMAVTALNIGDFEPDDELIVDQMLEPIVMGSNGLKKQGTVMLKKVEL
jgi:hypothetical protein